MRKIYYLFVLTFIFAGVSFSGCVGDPYTNGQQHQGNSSHNYPTTGQNPTDTDFDLDDGSDDSDRFTWQKPKEVIKRLGDVFNKTIADIGAGPNGYFTFKFARFAKKVISIDIDKEAIEYMENRRQNQPEEFRDKIETRLVPYDDPKLKKDEADIVFISNTFSYLEDRAAYLQKVKNGIPVGGMIYIVDFKMRKLPGVFPPVEERTPLYEVEKELEAAGFRHVISYDDVLEFQYIVIAEKVE